MDISKLSDEELRTMYGQASSPLANIPDEELKKLYQQTAPDPDENLSGSLPKPLEAFLVAAGKMTTRGGQGVQQGMDWLRGKSNPELAARVAEENRLYAPLAEKYPIATGLGEALPAMAVPVGMAGGTAAALMKAAAAGALPGAIEYGSLEDRAKRAGGGALGGLVGGAAGIGLGRALNPVRGQGPEYIDAMIKGLKKFDINGTAGQITGSRPLQYMESALAQLPGAAGRMGKVADAQRAAVNRATARTMGSDATKVTPEVVQDALDAAGSKIGDLTAKFDVPVSETLLIKLADVESRYMKRLPSQQRPIVQRYIDEILAFDGKIPGDIYQGIRADLGADAAGATKGSFKNALDGLKKALDSEFAAAADSPTNSALAALRAQYGNAKKLEGLASQTGDVSAARVANIKKSAGDLPELSALLGKMKPLPDSGTAQRSFWMNAFTKNPLELLAPSNLLGATGLPYAAATAVTRAPFKQYLTKGTLPVTPEMEKLLIRYGGLLGLAGASGGSQ